MPTRYPHIRSGSMDIDDALGAGETVENGSPALPKHMEDAGAIPYPLHYPMISDAPDPQNLSLHFRVGGMGGKGALASQSLSPGSTERRGFISMIQRQFGVSYWSENKTPNNDQVGSRRYTPVTSFLCWDNSGPNSPLGGQTAFLCPRLCV